MNITEYRKFSNLSNELRKLLEVSCMALEHYGEQSEGIGNKGEDLTIELLVKNNYELAANVNEIYLQIVSFILFNY